MTDGVRMIYAGGLPPQVHAGTGPVEESHFTPAYMCDGSFSRNKPDGGFWTSSWIGGTTHWMEWCCGNSFYGEQDRPWLVTPKPDAVLVQIDSFEDYQSVLAMYPIDRKEALGRYYEYHGDTFDNERAIHWARLIADGWDGVHVTRRGVGECRGGHLKSGFTGPELASWDVEQTVWFNWLFTDVEEMEWTDETRSVARRKEGAEAR